jgi:glutamyl-tRNA reductase
MSVLVMGVSHHSAPIALLDEVSRAGTSAPALIDQIAKAATVTEVMVLATCNRLEVYATVPQFHPAVETITGALVASSGVSEDRLRPHLFVHHSERAADHLFLTAAGLDSMVTGESQIRFQVRAALQAARDAGTVGPTLSGLVEAALRVGKRVQTETRIDQAGRSLADEGYEALAERDLPVDGATVLVLGAGSMASVAAVAARRRGAAEIVVVNRDADRGARLADTVGGVGACWDDLPGFLAKADVLVACTGAAGTIVDEGTVLQARAGATGRLGVLDLAMPHDVDPGVRDLPGVSLVTLGDLADRLGHEQVPMSDTLARARAIVTAEVDEYVAAQSAAAVAPTVVALRRRADDVVADELDRLRNRLGDGIDPRVDAEVAATVRRVVGKLLHTPTVRVKQAAASASGTDYEAALRHLFALDPGTGSAISRSDRDGESGT